MYYSLIQPYLSYGIILWGHAHKKYINKLKVSQNKTIRNINNSKYNESAKPIYSKLRILTLDEIYKIELCKFMYGSSTRTLPLPLLSLYTPNTEIHSQNTRQRGDAHVTARHTELLSRSLSHTAPDIWLTIHNHIKSILSNCVHPSNVCTSIPLDIPVASISHHIFSRIVSFTTTP